MADTATEILATMRNPVLVLDRDLAVALANRAFCETFAVSPEETQGRAVYELGNGQWDIPKLRRLLSEILTERTVVEDYRVEHEFERIGRRVMLLNARRLAGEGNESRVLLAIEDVTERERLRWELEAEKEFAENVVDASRDPLLILGWDLRVRSANETFYTQFQVDPGETEGRLVYELGNGQWNIPQLRDLLENVLPDNDAFDDFEVEHEFEEIGHRIMVLNARRIDHKEWILLAIEDVTERRKAERELRASEKRLAAILENTPVGIGLLDRDGRWTFANAEMSRWMGDYMPSRDTGRGSRWRGFAAEGRPLDPSEYPGARALRGERVPPEVDFLTDVTGEQRWLRVGAVPLPGDTGTVEHAVAIVQDVTEERQTLEALQASEAKYRVLFDSIDEGFCTIEMIYDAGGNPVDYRFLDVNAAFERQTGLADAAGKRMRALNPDHEKHWFEIYGRIAETGEAERFERPAAALGRYYEVYAFKVGAPDERKLGVLFNDIQERKWAEEERELLLRELSHRVKNTLAVVQALASQTKREGQSMDDYLDAFLGRLTSLAGAHTLLLDAEWRSTGVRDVVEQATEPYRIGQPDVVEIAGPPVIVSAKQGLGLSMILHELGTNAAKYGALTRPEGRLRVSWEIDRTDDGPQVRLTWQERHGPPVEPPSGKGFGTRMIEGAASYELEGGAELDYGADGLTCRVAFPLEAEG